MPDREPTKITWDDLNDRQVDDRLREAATISSTASHYERADVIAPTVAPPSLLRRLLFNAIVYLCAFGGVGAAAGWAVGEGLGLRRDRRAEATRLLADLESAERARLAGRYSADDFAAVRDRIERFGRDNPHFVARADASLAPGERERRLAAAEAADRAVAFRADLFAFGLVGVGIGAALAAAEPLVGRQWRTAAIDAALGAALGQAGGLVVAFAFRAMGYASIGDADAPAATLVRVAGWACLGAFVGASPGVVVRSGRRTLLGIAGGAIGGAAGGALFGPVLAQTDDARISRLIAAIAVGMASGAMIGALERAARQGWIRVVEGLIAGKQFILYRNPTLVGGAPTSHVYLFKDAAVGRRHAAIFRADDGHYEIENLPLGGPTRVNDVAIDRVRLRGGDRVRIGKTVFVFEERPR